MLKILSLARAAAMLLAAAAASLSASCAAAQGGGTGGIRGRAFNAADHSPVSYALVRLSPADGGAGRTALSDQAGVFLFAGVRPGTYRLSLERIGYATEVSEPFAIAAGETVERTLVSRPTAIALAAVVATPECRTAATLDRNPRLAALWREALKAIETTNAFADSYLYSYEQRQYWSTDLVNAPLDSVISRVVNDPRLPRVSRDREGWGHANRLRLRLEVPDGREILDPAFLVTHCLEGDASQSADGFELGFRPVRVRGGRIDIRGVVHVDRRTLQVKEIELEYVEGRNSFMQASVVYQDAVVPGGTVRLPAGMTFAGRPPNGVLIRPVRGQVQFVNYSSLTKVDAPAPVPDPAPAPRRRGRGRPQA